MKTPSVNIAYLALATAIIAVLGAVFLTLFFALGGDNPFGTLNDICGALTGILSAALIWMVHSSQPENPRANRRALWVSIAGAIIAVIGSALIILDVTGWVLAGLVSTFGYALIGLWLLAINSAAIHWPGFPRRLASFGISAGSVMSFGILTIFGILSRTDSIESAPWFVLAGLFIGGIGWTVLYPIWLVWFSRLLLSRRLTYPIQKIPQESQ